MIEPPKNQWQPLPEYFSLALHFRNVSALNMDKNKFISHNEFLPHLCICLAVLYLSCLQNSHSKKDWCLCVFMCKLRIMTYLIVEIVLPLFHDSLPPLCCISRGYRLLAGLGSPSAASDPSSTPDTNFFMNSGETIHLSFVQHNE